MEDLNTNRMNKYLTFLVWGLFVAVGIQSFFLIRIYKQLDSSGVGLSEGIGLTEANPKTALKPKMMGPDQVQPTQQLRIIPENAHSSLVHPQNPLNTPSYGKHAPGLFDSFFQKTTLGGFDPFDEMEAIRQEMDQILASAFGQFQKDATSLFDDNHDFGTEMDLTDDGDDYTIRIELPGVKETELSVDLQDQTLTVAGNTSEELKETDGNQMVRTELRSELFQRSIRLPGPVDAEKVNTSYNDGVLTVTVPKMEKIPAKRTMTI